MTVPRSLVVFALAFASMALVNMVHAALAIEHHRRALPEMAAFLDDLFLPAFLALRLAFAAWLGWLMIYRASNVAKWLFVLLGAIKLLQVDDAWVGLQTADTNSILWTISTVLALGAITCLFLPASRYWFSSKGRTIRGDAAVFE